MFVALPPSTKHSNMDKTTTQLKPTSYCNGQNSNFDLQKLKENLKPK